VLLAAIRPSPGAETAEQPRFERAAQIDLHISDLVVKDQVLQRLYDEPVAYRFVTSARPDLGTALAGRGSSRERNVAQESTEYASALMFRLLGVRGH
jgi:hypothetical protein